jgi:hypothetical protein
VRRPTTVPHDTTRTRHDTHTHTTRRDATRTRHDTTRNTWRNA